MNKNTLKSIKIILLQRVYYIVLCSATNTGRSKIVKKSHVIQSLDSRQAVAAFGNGQWVYIAALFVFLHP